MDTIMFKCTECHEGYLVPHIECSSDNKLRRYYKCNKCGHTQRY